MTMARVFISSDAYQWYESGPVRDVLISHNTFLRPASPVILVEPTNQVVDPAAPVHHGIRVRENGFRVADVRAVAKASPYVTSLFLYRGSSAAVIKENRFDNGLNLRAGLDATDDAEVTGDEVAKGADNVLPPLGPIRWTSGDPSVAAVDRTGAVTARRPGTATVTPTTSSRLGAVSGIPVTIKVGADCA